MSSRIARTSTGSGSPLYLLHGFTQTRDCWGPIPAALGTTNLVTAFDLPGHGDSANCPTDLVEASELLAVDLQPGTWIGYSLGGRYALHIALSHPELVDELVLIGAHPGISDPADREQRRLEDTTRACTIIVDGVSEFLDSWLDLPLFSGLSPEDQDRSERESNSIEGLVSSLMFASTGMQQNLWPRLAELAMPVKLVVGANDAKFLALAQECVAAIGDNANLLVVPNAGHNAHRENPEAFLEAIA